MHLHTESLGKTRPVKCERANSVWRNVVKTRLISYERRYVERDAAKEEKVIVYEHSNDWI